MVKVKKSPTIPATLNSDRTAKRRDELIANGAYIEDTKYNNRYKMDDIKESLLKMNHKKCVYCERRINDEYFPIEHYRPKSLYYWLAYSWDNLLLSCTKCNTKKSNKFEIKGQKATFEDSHLTMIHSLGDDYDSQELPSLINPEKEDVEKHLCFTPAGEISSDNARCKYTIKTCDLDRKSAQENRKTVWDNLYNELEAQAKNYLKGDTKALDIIRYLINTFKKDAINPKKEYLAFRRYILRERLIEKELQKLLS